VGVEWANTRKKFCTAFAEEIKIVRSGTNERNILQASSIKFMQSLFIIYFALFRDVSLGGLCLDLQYK